MRQQAMRIVAASSLLLLLTCVSAQAQQDSYRVKVNIPFQFNAGQRALPAGDYTIERITRLTAAETLSIRSADGHTSALVRVAPESAAKRQAEAQLVFHCYGDVRFLAQLRGVANGTDLQLPKSNAERRLEREARTRDLRAGDTVAQNAHKYQTVTLSLRQQ